MSCIAQKKSLLFGSLQHGAFLTVPGGGGLSIKDSNQPGFGGCPCGSFDFFSSSVSFRKVSNILFFFLGALMDV
jgi:hypothetical protein